MLLVCILHPAFVLESSREGEYMLYKKFFDQGDVGTDSLPDIVVALMTKTGKKMKGCVHKVDFLLSIGRFFEARVLALTLGQALY